MLTCFRAPTLQLVQVTTVGSSCKAVQPLRSIQEAFWILEFSCSNRSTVSTGQNFHFGNSRKGTESNLRTLRVESESLRCDDDMLTLGVEVPGELPNVFFKT
jgi:hypothetical protein